mmetsp:Transcript_10899/g.49142  ORF Transcript_10899/g.49142 Transcript_10899/m.49142 type:complete len:252 (+) Transcript_10899:1143-1898(+)
MWNIAHNLGGFAAPILAGTAARTLGWSWGLWAPGIIALFVGSLIMLTLKDSPEARGFSPVEQITVTSSQPDHNGSEIEITSDTSVENKSLLDNLFRNVLSNPFIWLGQYSSFCYIFCHVKLFALYVRTGDLRSHISACMSSDRYTASSYTPQCLANIHEVCCVSTSTGHNFLVCILSHQGKGGHRCGRCCGMRFYRRALDQIRHHVVSFHCRLESLVWNLVDFSAVSSRVELVTGILQPRLEEPSENEFKL